MLYELTQIPFDIFKTNTNINLRGRTPGNFSLNTFLNVYGVILVNYIFEWNFVNMLHQVI